MPENEIPTGARVEWTVQPAEILRIVPLTGERFGFDFRALAAGRAELRLKLSVGETVLLAQSTRRDAVYQWTGLEWTAFAPMPPGVSSAVLFRGAFTATGPSMGVQAWREGRWVQLADSVWNGDRLAAQRDRLWLGGTRRSGPMQFEVAFLRYLTTFGWRTAFDDGCGENCDTRIDHLRAHGDDLIVTRSTGSPAGAFSVTGRIRGGVREVIERDHWIEHSAVAAGRLFLANRTTVFLEEELGIREIGRVAGGEILDLEGFEDELYVCGSFREINGEEAIYLARWAP